jgi:hypothetical protein
MSEADVSQGVRRYIWLGACSTESAAGQSAGVSVVHVCYEIYSCIGNTYKGGVPIFFVKCRPNEPGRTV